MAESFSTRAKKFMGWDTSDDEFDEPEMEQEEPGQWADVTELSDYEPTPAVRRTETVQQTEPNDLARIQTIHATSYADARSIGDAFRSDIPVIVNMTDLPDNEARRVIDFSAGLVYGLRGHFERATQRVYLLSPRSVKVSSGMAPSHGAELFSQAE